MDRFPEAYERFERIMHPEDVENFRQLQMMFAEFAGSKWIPTSRQLEALRVQAEKHGIPTGYRRKFSSEYESFSFWMTRGHRTSRYEQRVISYMNLHPHSTLKEARGHRKR